MARAKDAIQVETPLYERDFCLWVEEQARLLREGRLEQLDVVNLIDEIEDLGINRQARGHEQSRRDPQAPSKIPVSAASAVAELAVVDRRAPAPAAQGISAPAPSLRGYAREQFEECYQDGRRQALIETGVTANALPSAPPYTLEQTLDPDFLPD